MATELSMHDWTITTRSTLAGETRTETVNAAYHQFAEANTGFVEFKDTEHSMVFLASSHDLISVRRSEPARA